MERKQAADLISENLNNIYGYAFARLYDKEDVDDLCAEIVCEVLKSVERIKHDEAFWGFLWKVAENTFRKFIRQKERQAQLVPLLDEDADFNAVASPETHLLEQAQSAALLERLRRELSLLSKTNREVCLAYYFQNKSCKEIAAEQTISLEMVKYHLFKTRQLLKEGIGMERTFGEKSYNPAKFEFNTIFSGPFNREYHALFSRRLPGNILHSAYYTPMTIRELSLELGVSTVYMEDEVALLEQYKLLSALPSGKYQSNLIIFTSAYTKELLSKAQTLCTEGIAAILRATKSRLPALRSIDFRGNDLEDTRLLWPLLWLLMCRGNKLFESSLAAPRADEDGSDSIGIHYGTDFEESFTKTFDCGMFAGYADINGSYALSFADFGVLPEACRCADKLEQLEQAFLSDRADCPVFTKEALALVEEALRQPINDMAALYGKLHALAANLMKQHAPKSIAPLVEQIVGKTLFFHTIGLLGRSAVQAGELSLPEREQPIAVYIFEAGRDYLSL